MSRTVWLSTGRYAHVHDISCHHSCVLCRGALVFPQFEHIVYLHPGDIIVFNGAAEWHANMVKPTAGEALRFGLGFTFNN